MKELTVFENSAFGSVRTVELDGEPWFVNKTPKVTGKGQVYFINRFLDRKEA